MGNACQTDADRTQCEDQGRVHSFAQEHSAHDSDDHRRAHVAICRRDRPYDESIVHRIHDATIGLVLLDRQMVGGTAYAVVPEIMYREYKALYLTLRRDHLGSAGRLAPPVDCGGFTEADRAMLRKVYRAAVFGEMPTGAQIAGDVRRRQAIYGAKLYKPSSKHVKGVSFATAAKKAILAQEFKGVDGAYTMSEKKNLARAIERVYNKKPSCDKS